MDSEIDKFRKTDLHAKATVMQQATEQAITAMHPSLSDMALQNKVMEKVRIIVNQEVICGLAIFHSLYIKTFHH